MNSEKMKKLARLALISGVNLQPGQSLVVNAHIESVDLARELTRQAYDLGAGKVTVKYNDEVVDHAYYTRGKPEKAQEVADWSAALYNDEAQDGAAFLYIIGEDPDLMADVNPALMAKRAFSSFEKMKPFHDLRDQLSTSWCIIAWPTRAWAKKVYPDLKEEEAIERLEEDIYALSRIDDNDPVENWKQHAASFDKRSALLNSLKIKKFHYENSLGTDLWVEMPEGYIFMGGSSILKNGLSTLPNVPTEEIFSAPHKDGVNGRVYSALPLIHNGSMIDEFWLEFKDGKVVDFDAKVGREGLQAILETDEGAKSLGEIALVPCDSPIAQKHQIFYSTLIDENASCHFALGQAYFDTLEGGVEMSREEQAAHGLNHSHTHVDFMVGTPDLKITAITEDMETVPVFEDGKFTALFD